MASSLTHLSLGVQSYPKASSCAIRRVVSLGAAGIFDSKATVVVGGSNGDGGGGRSTFEVVSKVEPATHRGGKESSPFDQNAKARRPVLSDSP
jgi:hypothetical protein